jgi:hypothetical protein
LPASNDPASLPQRFDEYARTVEGIVLRGIEHPSCELKRSLSLDRGELGDRLDFIKLIQGLANSHSDSECLIIIGADQKEGKFFNVDNADDFDPSRISPILSKYLSPEPKYEIFNNMRALGGERYVLIVMSRAQHRPVVTLVDGEAKGKVRFRPGDIWVKENTRLRPATREDLDRMYEPKIEQEAAKRARIIFEHMKADLGPELLSQAVLATPTPELLLGSRERLARFAEAMISSGDPSRFKMLMEMARQILVEKWGLLLQRGSRTSYGVTDLDKQTLADFYRNEFLPTLTSAVDLGIELIRFDGQTTWLGFIAELLVGTFETSSEIEHLQAVNQAGDISVPFARPAYEVYLGARVLATYAAFRNRLQFLEELLPQYVRVLLSRRSEDSQTPLLFWPFRGALDLPDMKLGRNQEFWQQRIEETWGTVFGSEDAFLNAASQLEFILEFNSYLLVQYRSPETDRFRQSFPDKRTDYLPDFWNTPLRFAIPTAERIFRLLVDDGFPSYLAIEPQVIDTVFRAMSKLEREVFFGEFLNQLKAWQDQAMMQQMRSPFLLSWPARLQTAIDQYKSCQPNQNPRS